MGLPLIFISNLFNTLLYQTSYGKINLIENMAHGYKIKGCPARLKYLLMLVLVSGLLGISTRAFSQTPPPGAPPPPPPPGELFKKINPFKKHKDTVNKKDTAKAKPAVVPAGGPPPPSARVLRRTRSA